MTRRMFVPLVVAVLLTAAPGVFAQEHSPSLDTVFKDFATDRSPGCAVGAARGDAPLDGFARERIFTPLGMRSTRFQHDHAAPIPGAELEATYCIVAGPDAVTLEMGNNMPVALRLTGPDVLRTPQGIELRPVRDSGSRTTGLTIGAGRVRNLAFIKR